MSRCVPTAATLGVDVNDVLKKIKGEYLIFPSGTFRKILCYRTIFGIPSHRDDYKGQPRTGPGCLFPLSTALSFPSLSPPCALWRRFPHIVVARRRKVSIELLNLRPGVLFKLPPQHTKPFVVTNILVVYTIASRARFPCSSSSNNPPHAFPRRTHLHSLSSLPSPSLKIC